MKKNLYCGLLAAIGLLFMCACEKYLTIDPPNNKLETSSVFSDSLSASSAITGIYSDMMVGNIGFVASQMRWAGLSADELGYSANKEAEIQFFNNDIQLDNTELNSLWKNLYRHIYQVNSVIEGISSSDGISQSSKRIQVAEAKFLRAFLFFYACNNWGGVPLTLTTDYRANENLARSSMEQVLDQVISDLEDAREALPAEYLTAERVRPNKWAATALLARAYLYQENWEKAAALSDEVIASATYSLLPSLNSIFLKESNETIWQLYPAVGSTTRRTYDGFYFIPASLPSTTIPVYYIPEDFHNSFELNDQREKSWMGEVRINDQPYYFPYKYKERLGGATVPSTEYTVVLRLAEQYLIRSEAQAHTGNLSGSISGLNIIRLRAGLDGLAEDLNFEQVLNALAEERKHEFFDEWGHRWFDLKRTGTVDAVMKDAKGDLWNAARALWPIPLNQLLANPNLIQNKDY